MWTGKSFILKDNLFKIKKRPHHTYRLRQSVLHPPEWFQQQLPSDVVLDGELWYGYNTVEELRETLCRWVIDESDWKRMKFVVFDSPDHAIRSKPYLQRHQQIKTILEEQQQQQFHQKQEQLEGTEVQLNAADSAIILVEPAQCEGVDHMNTYFQSVIERGGQGIVLRSDTEPYFPGYPMWKKNVS